MNHCRLVACCVAGVLCVCRAGVVGVGLAAHHPHTALEGTRATCLEVGLLRPCMGTHHPPSLHTPAWVEVGTTNLDSANNSSSSSRTHRSRTHHSKHQPLGLGRGRTPSPRSWSTPDSCKSR